jgi:predicted Zn-dependent protease
MSKVDKNTIYKDLYREIARFMKDLPEEYRDKLGTVFFCFDYTTLAYAKSGFICAQAIIGANTIVFYLDVIKNVRRTKKSDYKTIISHEIGHLLGLKESELPQLL